MWQMISWTIFVTLWNSLIKSVLLNKHYSQQQQCLLPLTKIEQTQLISGLTSLIKFKERKNYNPNLSAIKSASLSPRPDRLTNID